MSGIGNTNENSNGSRSNYAWQRAVLKLLSIVAGQGPATYSVTPSVISSSVDGSTILSKGVTILFRGTGGTINGVSAPDNSSFSFSPNGPGGAVEAIAYTVPTAGEARVIISYIQ